MKISKYPLFTIKETPSNAKMISQQLMYRSGMIRFISPGLYQWLPTGLRVLNKIKKIIREKMNKFGAIETCMPIIQPIKIWKKSKRDKQYGSELFQILDRTNHSYILGPSHEEIMTFFIKNEILSYKQYPLIFYQIKEKFRDEIRPRFGIIRSREFIMKDAYSFHTNKESLKVTYQNFYKLYNEIFNYLKIKFITKKAETGLIGGTVSHEFHAVINQKKNNLSIKSLNKKNLDDQNNKNQTESKKFEIGHIFQLENKYSKIIQANYQNKYGIKKNLLMGCYGIGISRIIPILIEQSHDSKGIIWQNEKIAPFQVAIIPINYHKIQKVKVISNNLYKSLIQLNIETIFYDKNDQIGVMLSNIDLIGIPNVLIININFLKKEKIEYIQRKNKTKKYIKISEIINFIKEKLKI